RHRPPPPEAHGNGGPPRGPALEDRIPDPRRQGGNRASGDGSRDGPHPSDPRPPQAPRASPRGRPRLRRGALEGPPPAGPGDATRFSQAGPARLAAGPEASRHRRAPKLRGAGAGGSSGVVAGGYGGGVAGSAG